MKDNRTHPIKKRIIELLARENNLYVGNIVKELSMSALDVTKHIIELKRSGIIKNAKDSARITLAGNS